MGSLGLILRRPSSLAPATGSATPRRGKEFSPEWSFGLKAGSRLATAALFSTLRFDQA